MMQYGESIKQDLLRLRPFDGLVDTDSGWRGDASHACTLLISVDVSSSGLSSGTRSLWNHGQSRPDYKLDRDSLTSEVTHGPRCDYIQLAREEGRGGHPTRAADMPRPRSSSRYNLTDDPRLCWDDGFESTVTVWGRYCELWPLYNVHTSFPSWIRAGV